MAATLAALHDVRPADVGLQRYGRATGYCRRQVRCRFPTLAGSLSSLVSIISWQKLNHCLSGKCMLLKPCHQDRLQRLM
jgi:hypothetical protein